MADSLRLNTSELAVFFQQVWNRSSEVSGFGRDIYSIAHRPLCLLDCLKEIIQNTSLLSVHRSDVELVQLVLVYRTKSTHPSIPSCGVCLFFKQTVTHIWLYSKHDTTPIAAIQLWVRLIMIYRVQRSNLYSYFQSPKALGCIDILLDKM